MTHYDAADLAHRLSQHAEAVCRHYLFSGRREGHYWLVGDVQNNPGRSLFVRLKGQGSGKGAPGKWTDAATGDHGDLLDIIRERCGLHDFRQVTAEARRFLSLPNPEPDPQQQPRPSSAPARSPEAARRLIVMAQPLSGTIAEDYLRTRGITALHETEALRFHPRCYYRCDNHGVTQTGPAMIASVTDCDNQITGVHRTWLSPDGASKAPVTTPRRAMGNLLGHAVRFGLTHDVMAVGEGIETILSLRTALPSMPMAAALSAAHLGQFAFPATLRRFYIARDADRAGDHATETLAERASVAGIEAIMLSPRLGDFNEDLRAFGPEALRAALRIQIAPVDVLRFIALPDVARMRA